MGNMFLLQAPAGEPVTATLSQFKGRAGWSLARPPSIRPQIIIPCSDCGVQTVVGDYDLAKQCKGLRAKGKARCSAAAAFCFFSLGTWTAVSGISFESNELR